MHTYTHTHRLYTTTTKEKETMDLKQSKGVAHKKIQGEKRKEEITHPNFKRLKKFLAPDIKHCSSAMCKSSGLDASLNLSSY